MPPEGMEALIGDLGRTPIQRTTLYNQVSDDRFSASFGALPLSDPIFAPAKSFERAE